MGSAEKKQRKKKPNLKKRKNSQLSETGMFFCLDFSLLSSLFSFDYNSRKCWFFFRFLKLIESYLGLFCFDFLNIKICSFLGFSLLAFMVSTLSSLLFFLFWEKEKKNSFGAFGYGAEKLSIDLTSQSK